MMNDTIMFPLVPAALVMVGAGLLLAGPWPVGLPALVAGLLTALLAAAERGSSGGGSGGGGGC